MIPPLRGVELVPHRTGTHERLSRKNGIDRSGDFREISPFAKNSVLRFLLQSLSGTLDLISPRDSDRYRGRLIFLSIPGLALVIKSERLP